VLGRDYDGQVCSISRTLEVVGERWSLLVVRDVSLGIRRFDALVDSLGVTRSVLSARLRSLEVEGVLDRHPYQDQPTRYEYHLTAKGMGLLPVIAHLMWWGDEYYPAPGGPPRRLIHHGCGGAMSASYSCDACGAPLATSDVASVPGPGFSPRRG
jgi:DNA-binding HxlR family transcriptional regulator